MVDDPVHHGRLREEGDDLHRASAAGVAAVKILLDHLLDDRPEISVFPLEATLVLRQKSLEMMKHHPVERRPLRMPGTIDSRHGESKASGNGPTSRYNVMILHVQFLISPGK